MSTKEIGDFCENIASRYLVEKGYDIIKRNYRVKAGEVDIIAMYSGVLVFIEVKTRKNSEFAYARESVNNRKQLRIRNVARSFISENYISYESMRFDVIEIYTDNKYIQHFKDTF